MATEMQRNVTEQLIYCSHRQRRILSQLAEN